MQSETELSVNKAFNTPVNPIEKPPPADVFMKTPLTLKSGMKVYPYTKRWWAEVLRNAARILETKEIAHVRDYGAPMNPVEPCGCILGACDRFLFQRGYRGDAQDAAPYYAKALACGNIPKSMMEAFEAVGQLRKDIMKLSTGYLAPRELTGANDSLSSEKDAYGHHVSVSGFLKVREAETARFCKALRQAATALERGANLGETREEWLKRTGRRKQSDLNGKRPRVNNVKRPEPMVSF